MRVAVLAILMAGAAAISAAPAQARELPFCIKGQGVDAAHGDCSFYTYEQCQAAASGRLNYCDVNPFFDGREAPPVRRPRARIRGGY